MDTPSPSMGRLGGADGASRRKVTTRFASAGGAKAAKGSASTSFRRSAWARTKAAKLRPRWASMAASAALATAASDLARASKATLPLERSVRTSVKPAFSKARFSSGIFAFVGVTPRRKATKRGMA